MHEPGARRCPAPQGQLGLGAAGPRVLGQCPEVPGRLGAPAWDRRTHPATFPGTQLLRDACWAEHARLTWPLCACRGGAAWPPSRGPPGSGGGGAPHRPAAPAPLSCRGPCWAPGWPSPAGHQAALSTAAPLRARQHEQDGCQPPGRPPAHGTTSSPAPTGARGASGFPCPLWQGSTVPSHGQPARAQGSPLPRGLAAPARYLGADKDLPEQGLDVVVGSSHNDRDLVSGKDIFNVPQSGSTSRGARCGGLQAAPAGPDPLW